MLKPARCILTKRKHLLQNLSEMQGGCGIKLFTSDTRVEVNRLMLVVKVKHVHGGCALGLRGFFSLRVAGGNWAKIKAEHPPFLTDLGGVGWVGM